MEKQLNISTTLSLPPDVVTQREAILAVSGAGKSNAARAMAEEFFAHKLPFVAVDPKGDWWGLRAGRDGSSKGGLDVVIFGGAHGDVPLERNGGAFVADLVTKERLSCIVDLKGFESKAARKHFLWEFAQRLYQKNQDPLKLFLDEADDYLPQKPMKDELRLLSAFEDIVRRGRSLGLGVTLITQRSAVVSKNVLTQCETLYVLRTTGPQDVAAVEAWMKYHGADAKMLATLAKLDDGEAWVWSPHYLKKMERFRFRLSYTFDSGATPRNNRSGSKRKPATLSDVDVAAITAKMSETIERAAAEDPRRLQERIRELEKALRQATAASSKQQAASSGSEPRAPGPPKPSEALGVAAPSPEPSDLLPWRQWVGRLRAELEFEQQRSDGALRRVEELETHVGQVYLGLESLERWKAQRPKPWTLPRTTNVELEALALSKMPGEAARGRIESKAALSGGPRDTGSHLVTSLTEVSPVDRRRGVVVQLNGSLPTNGLSLSSKAEALPSEVSKGELRILGALAHRGPLSKTRLAILTGYQHTAGGFATTMARLRERQWVDSAADGLLVLTDAALALSNAAPEPPVGDELVSLWESKLSGAARRLFEPIRSAGASVTAEAAAIAAGYKSAAGGNVAEGFAELRRYGLIEGTSKALCLGEAREDFL